MSEKKKNSMVKKRIYAFIIDFVIISIVSLTLYNILGHTGLRGYSSTIASFLYILKDCINGESIGKRCLNIRVVDKNDTSNIPSFVRLILRNVTLIIWPIELIVVSLDRNNERIGDKLAKTIVREV